MIDKDKYKLCLKTTTNQYKLEITDYVEQKIRFLCNKKSSVEWSGVLFYTISGSFETELNIVCKDIMLMDIGVATYTEFDISPDIPEYMIEHPELLDCKMGLIHSHNTMSTFFSGTDKDTLLERGSLTNCFVSLIVNNAGTYSAAITRKVETQSTQVTLKYLDFNNQEIQYSKTTNPISWIEYYMLDITKPDTGFEDLEDRINKIEEGKKAKTVLNSFNITNFNKEKTFSNVEGFPAIQPIQSQLPFKGTSVFDVKSVMSWKTIVEKTLQDFLYAGEYDVNTILDQLQNYYGFFQEGESNKFKVLMAAYIQLFFDAAIEDSNLVNMQDKGIKDLVEEIIKSLTPKSTNESVKLLIEILNIVKEWN